MPMVERSQNKPGKNPDKSGRQSREGHQTPVRDAKQRADVSDYVRSLSDEYRMLVVLKRQLYGGRWEAMIDDLQNRLAGKPYIFKLANRIQDDIERIEQMRKFEQDKKIDLADYVEMP